MGTKSLTTIAVALTVLGLIGPVMLVIGIAVLGGDLLDGFLGSRPTNSSAQSFFIGAGFYLSLVGSAVGVALGLIIVVRRGKRDWRAVLMPLCPLIGLGCCALAWLIANFV